MHCVCMCVHIGVTQWSGNSVVLKGERWGEAWGQDSTAKSNFKKSCLRFTAYYISIFIT